MPDSLLRHILPWQRSNDGPQTLRTSLLLDEQRHGLRDRRVAGQRVLDLAQLDADAVQLHLIVDAADDLDRPVPPPASEVAGPIATPPRGLCETHLRQFRPVQIPLTEANPAKPDLAHSAWWKRLSIKVADVEAGVRQRPASRQKAPLIPLQDSQAACDRVLRRAVGVKIAEPRRIGFHIRRHWRLAAGNQNTQRRGKFGPFKQPQIGRRDVGNGDAQITQEIKKTARRLDDFVGCGADRSATGKRRPDIGKRHIERGGGEHQATVIGCQAVYADGAKSQVYKAVVANQRALGFAGRS